MKYSLIVLSIALLIENGYGQMTVTEYDSLKKFSYPVIICGIDNKPIGTGSGFFLFYENYLYFLTNKHIAHDPNSYFFIIALDKSTQFKLRPSDYKEKPYKYDIDLSLFQVDIPSDVQILTVNRFIDKAFFNQMPSKIIICGLKGESFQRGNINLSSQPIISTPYNDYSAFRKYNIPDDTVKRIRQYSLIISDTISHGMSGAPGFGEFVINGKKTIKFMGVAANNLSDMKLGVLIKADGVFDFIDYVKK